VPLRVGGAVRETREGRNASRSENAEKNNNKLAAEINRFFAKNHNKNSAMPRQTMASRKKGFTQCLCSAINIQGTLTQKAPNKIGKYNNH